MDTSRRIRYFEMQHERQPKARFFLPLADLYMQQGRLDDAVSLLETGIQRHPASIPARLLLGLCYKQAGRLDEASTIFEHVLAHDPDNSRVPRPGQDVDPVVETKPEAVVEAPLAEPPESVDEDPQDPVPIATPEPVPEPTPEPDPEPEPVATSASIPEPAPDPDRAPTQSAATTVESAQESSVPSLFVTSTLADIYLAQNHREKALTILYQVLADHPERSDIAARISEIEAEVPGAEAQSPKPDPAEAAASSALESEAEARSKAQFKAWLDREMGEESE